MTLSEHILDVSESTFEEEVIIRSHQVPVVVDFWAEWCGPCRILGPLLERLAIESGGSFTLAKVDVDENSRLSVRYGVQGIPAVKAFRNGEVVSEFVGAQPEPVVRRFVERLIPDPGEQAVKEGLSLLATRHWEEAEGIFRSILEEDDSNSAAALGLAKSLLMQGSGEEASRLLREFPDGAEWASAQKLKPLARLLIEYPPEFRAIPDEAQQARMQRAAELVRGGNLPAAMDGLLDVLRTDKTYQDGLPKAVMLAIFELLGEGDPLTREYRDELASVLF